jgi:hypothetical protein
LIRNGLQPAVRDDARLAQFLEQVHHAVLENLELFQPDEDDSVRMEALEVVLLLFRNLFGSIEYESDGNALMTDFSHIRAGSLLKAHGGFVMLHLRDLLADEPVLEKLRRFMRSGRLQIEEPGMMHAPVAAVSLEPETVDVQVKIVLVASVQEY